MRKTIQSDMFGLIMECEAWSAKGEPGLPVQDVLSPSLIEIVERGRYIEWEQQTSVSIVSFPRPSLDLDHVMSDF
jgi:hypothetical protein